MNEYTLVLTTVPEEQRGQEIARKLVEERLAACVTVSGAGQSFYWWEKKISRDREFILFIKTKARLYPELEKRILSLHPYQVPEIIALPIIRGFEKYLSWLDQETQG
jgi:periplasmic divalent cation tolerance protein